jgi:hypothetical protein
MLANAVSSAVERLYAAVPAAGERVAVSRVAAVSAIARLKPAGEEDVDRDAEVREERDRVQHRQALTRGVLAVFEASTTADTLGAGIDGSSAVDGVERPAAEANLPDPQLEAAILRFIHTMFRSLADAEPEGTGVQPAADKPAGPTDSREALSARIESLAQRFAEASDDLGDAADVEADNANPGDPARLPASFGQATEATAPARPDSRLQEAYAEVVQALNANIGSAGGDGSRQPQATRAELASMMQRLALAMHGSPPIDPGLPTRGGLLSARA